MNNFCCMLCARFYVVSQSRPQQRLTELFMLPCLFDGASQPVRFLSSCSTTLIVLQIIDDSVYLIFLKIRIQEKITIRTLSISCFQTDRRVVKQMDKCRMARRNR